MKLRRSPRPAWANATSRVLAAATTPEGTTWLLGTRSSLVTVTEAGVLGDWPWEQIQAADWDADEHRLRISLIGTFGQPREQASHVLVEAALLLQLLRERITASIVHQRHVVVDGKRGFRAIGRRNPAGGEITWMCELDRGVDPDTPGLQQAMDVALEQLRVEVGE